MSSPGSSIVDAPARATRCDGSGQPAPPQDLPEGPRLRAGVCPSCGRLYARNPRTGTIHPHRHPGGQASAQLPSQPTSQADAPVLVVGPEEPFPVVHSEEPEDPEEPDEPATLPTGVRMCAECTILIGPSYIETVPYLHPHREGVVCFRCLESLERRAARGPASESELSGLDRRFR
jgi:hypothetical protein